MNELSAGTKKGGRCGEVAISGGLTVALSVLPTSEMKNSTQTALLFQSCLWICLVYGYVKHTVPICQLLRFTHQAINGITSQFTEWQLL